MKKFISTNLSIVLSCLFIFFSFAGYAQEQEVSGEETLPTAKFGIKGGLNLANLYIDNVKDQNVKAGFVGGVFAKLPVSKGLSIQPELLYSNKGAQATYDNGIQGQGVYRFNLNYIELPLTLVVNVVKNFNIHFGGYAAYLASANVKNVQEGTIIGVTDLNENDFNRFDYGLVGGLGLDVKRVGFGVRYNYGLRELGVPGTLAGELTKNSRNSSLSLYIAFAF